MDTRTYPGKGLSLSQLVFALNEELKHPVHSPSFTLDEVSQLDRDVSTASVAIREWKNPFVPINRILLDVLSLIPTHLSSQKDRFQATFVCRHWRRTFLQHGALWSQLYVSKGEVYVKTFLERAKGSALDILVGYMDPLSTITLLLPHTEQIRSLDFNYTPWADIQGFSELNSGPLPLLRVLRINLVEEINLDSPDAPTHSSPLLFDNAVNLQEFSLHSLNWPPSRRFVFPNLTFFELSALSGTVQASQLLDFLEASSKLQTVDIQIYGFIFFEGVPRERVAVLHNVKSFCLVVGQGEAGYKLATHISCPSAEHTSLTYEHEKDADGMVPEEILPASVSWNAIVRQYARSPVEDVALEITIALDTTAACSLIFRSSDASVIRLRFEVSADDQDEDEDEDRVEASTEMFYNVFSQASRTIHNLASVKRLQIRHNCPLLGNIQEIRIVDAVRRLFESLNPLEELILPHCEMRPYLDSLIKHPGFRYLGRPVVFPPIRDLTIVDPLHLSPGDCAAAIVRLAESRHALGVPFERVTVRMDCLPEDTAERLGPWVGTAHCSNELI